MRRVLLLLVGGNSECSGKTGLWPVREQIANDMAFYLGLPRTRLSTDYVAWTGDAGSDPGCLPANAKYVRGHLAISERLASYGPLSDNVVLVVVGWSNGGATAAQLSAYLDARDGVRPVSLLVTLDPVSRLTARPEDGGAKTWLNVYTHSKGIDKLRVDNMVAAAGNAWNDFSGPQLMACMQGNHGEAGRMWRAVILPSKEFQEWTVATRQTLGTAAAAPQPLPHLSDAPC